MFHARSLTLLLALSTIPAFPADFEKEVYPLLKRSCFGCHGPKMQQGQLRLDAKSTFLKGGKSGVILTAGKSAESPLVKRIEGAPGMLAMPPAGQRLTPEEIAKVRAWIDDGAKWPDGFGADATSKKLHWSYIKPMKPATPAMTAWTRTPLDAFILARLEK